MTETGFRDLFVELPAVLFEALRGIGEAAVRQAQRPAAAPQTRARLSDLDALHRHERAICGAFDWIGVQSVHSPRERAILVSARLACGHRVRYSLDECTIAATSLTDALYAAVDARPRGCYCVPALR